jgi:hypothetical protein
MKSEATADCTVFAEKDQAGEHNLKREGKKMDELKRKRQHVRKLMRYAVPAEDMAAALDLLLLFGEDRLALAVLEEFYSFLPEAGNDWIKELRLAARRQGIFLLAAMTSADAYLYLVSAEGIEFNGSLSQGWLDGDLLDFFGFADLAAFKKAARNFPEYQPLQTDAALCPACQSAAGELHELGCPVEVCPWCGGQLIHCSCRFDQLGIEEMTARDLLRFEALLVEQGRIACSPEQLPSFADDGAGVLLD